MGPVVFYTRNRTDRSAILMLLEEFLQALGLQTVVDIRVPIESGSEKYGLATVR